MVQYIILASLMKFLVIIVILESLYIIFSYLSSFLVWLRSCV